MARKIDDFKCLDCGEVSELFLDQEKEKATCTKCGSEHVEKILSQGTGKYEHSSWARWRI